jgi:protein disulfide-isomerase
MEQDISNQFDMKSITYDEALAQAKAQKKLVLLDFTGSDWCPYCQDLDREVLSSRAFQTYSVSRFVFVVVDFPHDTPLLDDVRQQNDMLKDKYGINGYPTLIVTDANGKELGRTSGYNPGSGSQAVIESLKPFLPN